MSVPIGAGLGLGVLTGAVVGRGWCGGGMGPMLAGPGVCRGLEVTFYGGLPPLYVTEGPPVHGRPRQHGPPTTPTLPHQRPRQCTQPQPRSNCDTPKNLHIHPMLGERTGHLFNAGAMLLFCWWLAP